MARRLQFPAQDAASTPLCTPPQEPVTRVCGSLRRARPVSRETERAQRHRDEDLKAWCMLDQCRGDAVCGVSGDLRHSDIVASVTVVAWEMGCHLVGVWRLSDSVLLSVVRSSRGSAGEWGDFEGVVLPGPSCG